MDITMVQTPRGKVIDAKSMTDLGRIQNDRKKLVFEKENLPSDHLAIIDAEMAKNDFEWLYSGVNKSEKAIRGIFYHRPTGYVFRAELSPSSYKYPIVFAVDSWASSEVHYSDYSDGKTPITGIDPHRAVRKYVDGRVSDDIITAIVEIANEALVCYGTANPETRPIATPVIEKKKITTNNGELKSADHVEVLLKLINQGDWFGDYIWEQHRNDEEHEYVDLPDRVTQTSGGLVMIERGRRDIRSTGEKSYRDREEFENKFFKTFSHWPRPGKVKKSQWRRDYRKADNGTIERRFDLSCHSIYAITREKDNRITSVKFYTHDYNGDTLLKLVTNP